MERIQGARKENQQGEGNMVAHQGIMRHVYVLALVSLLLLVAANALKEDMGRNNEVVSRLRAELAAAGVDKVPDPPRQLGVHAACLRHGMSCPDSYVEFLEKQLPTAKQAPSVSADSDVKMAKKREGLSGKRLNKQKKEKMHTDGEGDAVKGVELENVRRLRNVLRDQLKEVQSPARQWRCQEMHWSHMALRAALAFHDVLTMPYWGLVMQNLLVCAILTAILTWIFFADRIPSEHLSALLSDDPSVIFSGRHARSTSSRSLAELVVQRERYRDTDECDYVHGGASNGTTNELELLGDAVRHSSRNYRRTRWIITRFSLLESYEESRLGAIVLKLRLVLTAMIFLLLLWTLFSLPLRASDLRGGTGLLHHAIAVFCPSWMTASMALYLGWSWIGGMVGYAGWELVSAGEAFLKSDERAAALHEKILHF